MELDDLAQEGFIAVCKAVQDFKPDGGYLFTTYLSRHIKTQVAAFLGFRTGKQKRERREGVPLSLDEPLPGEDAEATRADLLPDKAAAEAFEAVEYREWRRQLRAALESCLEALPPEQAHTIRAHYFDGLTLASIGQRAGWDVKWARAQENQAMRALRKPRNGRLLQGFRDDIISCHAFHSGLQSFRDNGASSVEITVEHLQSPCGYIRFTNCCSEE